MGLGVQVSAPAVRLAFGVNTALCPAGSPLKSAVSDAIASPSGSAAVTFNVNGVDGLAVAHAYLMLYMGQVAADLRWIKQTVGAGLGGRVEPPTLALGLLGEAIPAGEYVAARRNWNVFARAMGDFHTRYDLYLTPTTASLPVILR